MTSIVRVHSEVRVYIKYSKINMKTLVSVV